jgi:hypothetical protein
MPGEPAPYRFASENWAALVNDQGIGLTLYTPRQYPYVTGRRWDGTTGEYGNAADYLLVKTPFTFGPQSVLEGDIYLIAGDYRSSRQTVVTLQGRNAGSDFLPPLGWLDAPFNGQTATGNLLVSGWAFDDTGVSHVEVLVDGVRDGGATYGAPRSDVSVVYPNAPVDVGFTYVLDTARYANGFHSIEVRATDTSGHMSVFRRAQVTIDNPAPSQPAADAVAPAVAVADVSPRRRDATVTVAASDNVGVTRVELLVDGRVVATATSAPYTFRVSAKGYKPGAHQIGATARDAAGNVGTAAPVTWTVR